MEFPNFFSDDETAVIVAFWAVEITHANPGGGAEESRRSPDSSMADFMWCKWALERG